LLHIPSLSEYFRTLLTIGFYGYYSCLYFVVLFVFITKNMTVSGNFALFETQQTLVRCLEFFWRLIFWAVLLPDFL